MMPNEMDINVNQPQEDNINIELSMSQQIADLSARVASLESDPAGDIEIKTTAGDFADADSWNGRRVLNTSDNNYKLFSEGSWRTIFTY